jgi:predicted metal-dependent peptidase
LFDPASIVLPDQAVLDRMMNQTKGLLFAKKGAGFLGSMLCDTDIIWHDEKRTAWTNGEVIAFNRKFFFWLTPQERVTVLAHELWHIACDHMGRFDKSHIHEYWNQAADFFINLMLKNNGYTFGPLLMSIKPCLDAQYDNMTTEQIYQLLLPPPSSGSCSSSPSAPPSNESGIMEGDLGPYPSEITKAKIVKKIVKALQAAKRSNEAGTVPGEVKVLIDEFLNPVLPWEVLLARFFTELSNDDYSWRRPSRRFDEEYLPSLIGENGLEHLIYYLDLSGSTSDLDVKRFNSEVKFIHEQLKPKLLTLVTFDTQITGEFVFTDDMPFEKLELHGRGGTCLKDVHKHIVKHKPSAAVIFTDLYVTPMREDPSVPLLWVCVNNPTAKVPFGRLIHLPKEKA